MWVSVIWWEILEWNGLRVTTSTFSDSFFFFKVFKDQQQAYAVKSICTWAGSCPANSTQRYFNLKGSHVERLGYLSLECGGPSPSAWGCRGAVGDVICVWAVWDFLISLGRILSRRLKAAGPTVWGGWQGGRSGTCRPVGTRDCWRMEGWLDVCGSWPSCHVGRFRLACHYSAMWTRSHSRLLCHLIPEDPRA